MNPSFDKPILFIIFNRPDTTKLVFEAIRNAQPKQLFIAADGPRLNNEGDIEKCKTARAVALPVDWNCEVRTLFRDTNLGCKKAVSSASGWFFQNVEEGIILEDDCLPAQSFFPFCAEMLTRFRHSTRIMHINGSNFQDGLKRSDCSYGFARYAHVWGWATWRRCWTLYDVNIRSWPTFYTKRKIGKILSNKVMQLHWNHYFFQLFKQEVDTWDVQWVYTIWNQDGCTIQPEVNLVTNIGFRQDATHTTATNSLVGNVPSTNITFPLNHPTVIDIDNSYDWHTFLKETGNRDNFWKIKQWLKMTRAQFCGFKK